jgi:polar amino acid transport system substrate-binding protein
MDFRFDWPGRMKKIYLPGLAILVLTVGIILLVNDSTGSIDNSLDQIKSLGVIRIGYAVEAPYAFIDEAGRVTGESPEVARVIVNRMGIQRIDWVQTEFGLLIAGLEDAHYDLIAAGMFITPERSQVVSFSEPTFHVQEGMLVEAGNPHHLHSYHDLLDQSGIRVAALDDSVENHTLLELGFPKDQLLTVPDALTGKVAVDTHLVDGLALSSITIQWMEMHDQLGKTEMARPFNLSSWATDQKLGYGGFVFRTTDVQLLNAWNHAQQGFIGSPEHQKLVQSFGFSAAEMPGEMSTSEIIGP